MSLDAASLIARQSLLTTQQQIMLSGRNISAAADPTRSRVEGVQVTTWDGSVRISQVRRAEDAAIYNAMVKAVSTTAERDAVLAHLDALSNYLGDTALEMSPAALIGELEAAVAAYANQPDDPLFGRAVVATAHDVANALNDVANEINLTRERADENIDNAVTRLNDLLVDFHEANDDVVNATVRGIDATVHLDKRDAIVAEMNEYLGVTTLVRDDNDMALFTDGGVTLFDQSARSVEFERTTPYTVATIGGDLIVDGIPVTSDTSPMPSSYGSIVGDAAIRDEVFVTFRLQMDEVARELVEMFSDGIGSLFTTTGPPDYAGTIAVSADVDPAQGGSVENLRDGTGNPSGYAAYGDRLQSLLDGFQTEQTWDTDAELGDDRTVNNFAAGSISWLEGWRKAVADDADTQRAILEGTSVALAAETGVNMDDEYARQLQLERSFAASSRLLAIVDEMFNNLMSAV